MEEARKENETLNTRNRELDDKLKQNEQKETELEKQISDIKKELDDPCISKQKEEELRGKLGFLQTQLDELKKNNKSYQNEIKRNKEQTKNNSRIISGGATLDDKH
jgi:chromosome segregation ATPase